MNILVNHQITDPDAYWGVLGAKPEVPLGFEIITFMAGEDPAAAACLWSAPDLDSLEALVEGTVGHACTNTFMVIDDSKSFGF